MLPSENNHNPSSEQPTGDLEHLFRQKFAEAEVQPRASLWEQLDHNLVVGQNETYRRRLVLYRWVAAASVALLVSFGSWFGLRYGGLSGALPDVAARSAESTQSTGAATGTNSANVQLALGQNGGDASAEAGSSLNANGALTQSQANGAAAGSTARTTASAAPSAASLSDHVGTLLNAVGLRGSGSSAASLSTGMAPSTSASQGAGGGQYAAIAAGSASQAGAASPSWGSGLAGLTARMASLPGGAMAVRPAMLPQTAIAAAVTARTDETQDEATSRPRRWRLLGSYAASAYNPNMTFSRTAAMPASVANMGPVVARPATDSYSVAAAEYRRNLRAGLSQRVALTASYAAKKHWTLLAGAEAAEQRASSRTSYGFLDGKHAGADATLAYIDPTVGTVRMPESRTTSYRYRSVSVPVEVRYGTAKTGVSMYAKAGAAVGLLLNSRTELEGSPEATKVYNFRSADSPYRQVQVALRGGAGARYQPANATWSVAVGPTAEAGLTTMNEEPAQRLLHRTRPYSLGMEASVEFGKAALAP